MKKYKIKKRIKRSLIYAILAVLLLIMVFPMVITVLDSFMPGWQVKQYIDSSITDKALKLIPAQATMEQYNSVLVHNYRYWDYFWNSILLTVPIVIGQVIVSILAAYFFTVIKSKYKEWLFFAYIIVMLLPFQVTLVPAYLTANTLGLLDNRWSIILPGIFSTFGVFLLRQHMEQIPKTFFDAAKSDGAGLWQTFFHVAAPMCKTSIVALIILCFIDNWNMIEQPLIFLSDKSKLPLSLYFFQINSQAIGVAFAASVIYMIPILLVFANGEKELMEGIRLSGIK